MSELIQTKTSDRHFRVNLLTTVCGLTLLASLGTAKEVKAEYADRPTVWIEIGGQLERMGNSEETFAPAFVSKFDHLNLEPILPQQRPPRYSNGAEAKISFTPQDSDWVLSAAVRYGRANGQRILDQQLPKLAPIKGKKFDRSVYYITQKIPYHLNDTTQHMDRHLVLDFQAGKDVGLGLFTSKDISTVSLGVRFAQFTAARSVGINGDPDFKVIGTNQKYGVFQSRHHYSGSFDAESSFHGVGPSLSWSASVPLVSREDSQISMDWGVNAAVLFGRQKSHSESNVTGSNYTQYVKFPNARHNNFVLYQHASTAVRSRSVIVPNLGGFAGASFRYSDLRVSMGYRADVFFGAINGGIAERDSENRSFYGPFASFSIGLGG